MSLILVGVLCHFSCSSFLKTIRREHTYNLVTQECLSQKLYDENLPFFFEDLYINETGT